jgi:hypothetical protein
MRRVIIHAGFHKTGTTHLQQTLRVNRAALHPDVRLVLRPGMVALCETARAYSKSREDYDLALIKYEAAMLIERLSNETATTLILSSEDLAGHMPGRHSLHGYGAAPAIMQAIAVGFRTAAPDDELTFFFTARAAEPWLRSCYAQHLRASRMIWDEADYLKRFKTSAEHGKIINLVRRAIPSYSVLDAALEDHSTSRLGIAAVLLDHAGIDPTRRAALIPSDTRNSALPPALLAEILTLNRSDLSDASLQVVKRKLIEGAA